VTGEFPSRILVQTHNFSHGKKVRVLLKANVISLQVTSLIFDMLT